MSGGNRHYEHRDLVEFSEDLAGKLVIVEGKKDGMALKSLGVKNIVLLNGRPLTELALHVSRSIATSRNEEDIEEAVILTDFDSEGKRIAARLEYLLKKHKVMVNSRIRRKFMKFGKTRIEDLKEGDVHGKASSNFNKIRDKRADKGQWRG
ncbi:MAG: toprim domain-containing protein [Candidatus Aenigmarchaeota archaeon]|nr:toprim domain-containing protein [Candidatus Aenigmarchaeota archaeon]